ncbi:MAG: DUF2341 domain-containing protein [Desulfobacteraceae bacterium]|nr:DUF2341 domain-containing protein [Desulfobacteraceae bacterium]
MTWLPGWVYRKRIIIPSAHVDSDLADFPFYVKIDNDADFHEARPDGHDIRFTLSDGLTLLKNEREHWSGGNGNPATAHFWVKVPSILASGGAVIYIYYGKSDAPDGEDAPNVWDANCKAVWHLKEIGNGTEDEFKDSSGNANHGTGGGGNPDKTPTQADGKIYKGQAHDGLNDLIDTPYGFDIDPSLTPHTFSMVVKSNDPEIAKIFFSSGHDGTNRMYLGHYDGNWRGGIQLTSWGLWGGPATTELTHVALVMDGSYASIFINGEFKYRLAYTSYNFYQNIDIGCHAPGSFWLDGLMDEVRISNVGRSLAWVKFESCNIMEPDNEITWGIEEAIDRGVQASREERELLLIGNPDDIIFLGKKKPILISRK